MTAVGITLGTLLPRIQTDATVLTARVGQARAERCSSSGREWVS
jgi:hypothetical protein